MHNYAYLVQLTDRYLNLALQFVNGRTLGTLLATRARARARNRLLQNVHFVHDACMVRLAGVQVRATGARRSVSLRAPATAEPDRPELGSLAIVRLAIPFVGWMGGVCGDGLTAGQVLTNMHTTEQPARPETDMIDSRFAEWGAIETEPDFRYVVRRQYGATVEFLSNPRPDAGFPVYTFATREDAESAIARVSP